MAVSKAGRQTIPLRKGADFHAFQEVRGHDSCPEDGRMYTRHAAVQNTPLPAAEGSQCTRASWHASACLLSKFRIMVAIWG